MKTLLTEFNYYEIIWDLSDDYPIQVKEEVEDEEGNIFFEQTSWENLKPWQQDKQLSYYHQELEEYKKEQLWKR